MPPVTYEEAQKAKEVLKQYLNQQKNKNGTEKESKTFLMQETIDLFEIVNY